MFQFWKKSKSESSELSTSGAITWDPKAQDALAQAVAQAPVPAMMKSMVKNELKKAAEEYAQKNGHTSVTPEDLMQGLMAKLPDNMKAKVENALKKGPSGLKDLEKELKN